MTHLLEMTVIGSPHLAVLYPHREYSTVYSVGSSRIQAVGTDFLVDGTTGLEEYPEGSAIQYPAFQGISMFRWHTDPLGESDIFQILKQASGFDQPRIVSDKRIVGDIYNYVSRRVKENSLVFYRGAFRVVQF